MAKVIAGMTMSLYEFQVPIFVLTHSPPDVPPKEDDRLSFTFVSDDVASAIEQAKAAAGDKAVTVVGGPGLVQELLRAGFVDELRVDVMPVLVGSGPRLFENLDPDRLQLEADQPTGGRSYPPTTLPSSSANVSAVSSS